jgi:hypothetical protein
MSQPFEPKHPQQILDRYVLGLESAKEIALDFGYSQPTAIRNFLLKAGVQLRSREEAQEIVKQRGKRHEPQQQA